MELIINKAGHTLINHVKDFIGRMAKCTILAN